MSWFLQGDFTEVVGNGFVCRRCPAPNRTQEISLSASATGSATEAPAAQHAMTNQSLRGQSMVELKVSERTVLLADVGAALMLQEQSIGLNGTGKLEIDGNSIIDMRALASATWPEVLGGPEGKYEGGMSLMEAEQELIGVSGSIEGRQTGAELTGAGAMGMRVAGTYVISGSGDLDVMWSDGLQLRASVSNGPNVLAVVDGSAHVHGGGNDSVVSFMENYMLDEGKMDFGIDMTLLNARVMNVTGSLTSSDMRAGAKRRNALNEGTADVACLLLDAGGVFLGNEGDENSMGKMQASSDLRFTNFGNTNLDEFGRTTTSTRLWDATLEHAMISMTMLSFEDTMTETNDAYEEPPPCTSTSSGILSFGVGKMSDFHT